MRTMPADKVLHKEPNVVSLSLSSFVVLLRVVKQSWGVFSSGTFKTLFAVASKGVTGVARSAERSLRV